MQIERQSLVLDDAPVLAWYCSTMLKTLLG